LLEHIDIVLREIFPDNSNQVIDIQPEIGSGQHNVRSSASHNLIRLAKGGLDGVEGNGTYGV
jgi:hypothetical protein